MTPRLVLLILALASGVLPATAQEAPPVTDPQEARAELREVLAQPEFVNATKPGLIEQLGQWLYAWLARMDTNFQSYEVVGQLTRLSYALMWIILISSILALGYWIFSVFKRRRWEEEEGSVPLAAEAHGHPASSPLEAAPLDADDPLLRRVLVRWRSFLHGLQDQGLTPPVVARTNREVLRTLPDVPPPVGHSLETLATAYDRHVFGHQTPTAAEAEAMEQELASASRELGSPQEEAR